MAATTRKPIKNADKLALALKRNMARRKQVRVANTVSSMTSPPNRDLDVRSASREPRSAGGSEAKGRSAPSTD
jgi:hypothetical protein